MLSMEGEQIDKVCKLLRTTTKISQPVVTQIVHNINEQLLYGTVPWGFIRVFFETDENIEQFQNWLALQDIVLKHMGPLSERDQERMRLNQEEEEY